MKIEAVHCFNWKIGFTPKELESAGWEIGPCLEGFGAIFLYTAGNDLGSTGNEGLFPEIKYFSVETAGGKFSAHVYKSWEHLLGIIQKMIVDGGHAKRFGTVGDDPYLLSALVFRMGWTGDVFLLPGYKLNEGDISLNATKFKSKLAKYPENIIVVHRETWRGVTDVTLADLKGQKGIPYPPEDFELDDRLEATRVYYRAR
jgi:hypothetical protein